MPCEGDHKIHCEMSETHRLPGGAKQSMNATHKPCQQCSYAQQGKLQVVTLCSVTYQSCQMVLAASSRHVLQQMSLFAQRCPQVLNIVPKSQARLWRPPGAKLPLAGSFVHACMPWSNCHVGAITLWMKPESRQYFFTACIPCGS